MNSAAEHRKEKPMENATMGKVVVHATIENLEDIYEGSQGRLAESAVRRLDVDEAVRGPGAFRLSLPKRLITKLGLRPWDTRSAHTTNGIVERTQYSVVRLTVQGRHEGLDQYPRCTRRAKIETGPRSRL
jgi:hypothetical protein